MPTPTTTAISQPAAMRPMLASRSEKTTSLRNSEDAGPENHFTAAVATISLGGGKNGLLASLVTSSQTSTAPTNTTQRCRKPRTWLMTPPVSCGAPAPGRLP